MHLLKNKMISKPSASVPDKRTMGRCPSRKHGALDSTPLWVLGIIILSIITAYYHKCNKKFLEFSGNDAGFQPPRFRSFLPEYFN
jgi:hypothetical protein